MSEARAALERIAEQQNDATRRMLGLPPDAPLPPAGGVTILPADPLARPAEQPTDQGGKS